MNLSEVATTCEEQQGQQGLPVQRRVSFIEGNPIHTIVLSRMLQKVGWDVHQADTENALISGAALYDIALIDCDSAQLDGFALARRLRDADPEHRTTLIALTSEVAQVDRRKRKAAGFDDYIKKPVSLDRLKLMLARHSTTGRPVASPIIALDSARMGELVSVFDGDIAEIRNIFNTYLTAASRLLETARRAEEDSDIPTLVRATASLRSVSATVGASRLVEICDVIGALARAEALAGLPALIGELSLAFERVGCDLRSVEIDIAEQRSKQLKNFGSVGSRNGLKHAGPYRVLLAESDPLIAKFLTASLRSAGFESDQTDDGHCALTLVREGRFDVLIIQAALRGLDGYELLSKIRLDPASHTTPVIVLSARRQEEEVLRAFELGADDFVPLPLNPLEISARVRRLVRNLYVWPTL